MSIEDASSGVFGIDLFLHHNRPPDQQSRLERVVEALSGAVNPEQTLIAETGIEVVEMLLAKNLNTGRVPLTRYTSSPSSRPRKGS